jgi:hypothetical protein
MSFKPPQRCHPERSEAPAERSRRTPRPIAGDSPGELFHHVYSLPWKEVASQGWWDVRNIGQTSQFSHPAPVLNRQLTACFAED